MSEDPYDTLGLERGVQFEVVRKQFLALAARLHPDKGGKDLQLLDRVRFVHACVSR